jgi:hypothetical protein
VLPDNLKDWISKQEWCNNDYLKKTAATMAKPGSSAHFICHESYLVNHDCAPGSMVTT